MRSFRDLAMKCACRHEWGEHKNRKPHPCTECGCTEFRNPAIDCKDSNGGYLYRTKIELAADSAVEQKRLQMLGAAFQSNHAMREMAPWSDVFFDRED